MNICLQSIFEKTIFFESIARKLSREGHNVFWTATSLKWRAWLIEQGVAPDHILLLRHDESESNSHEADMNSELLSSIEAGTDFKFKEIYFTDRIVRHWEWDKARAYYGYCVKQITAFIKDHKMDIMLGEATASDELINSIVCGLNQVRYYPLGTLRIPSDRFLFFKNHLMEEYELIAEEGEEEKFLEKANDVRTLLIKGLKPNYWYWNNKTPTLNKLYVRKLGTKLIEALSESKTDATVKPLSYHLRQQKQYLKPFRFAQLRLSTPFELPTADEPYVLYTIHKQPEASIDVVGSDYSNQLELIKNIVQVCVIFIKKKIRINR